MLKCANIGDMKLKREREKLKIVKRTSDVHQSIYPMISQFPSLFETFCPFTI